MIPHIESTKKIYVTNNYDLFIKILGNRDLNPKKIKRIIADIESGLDLTEDCPIICNEVGSKLEIIDGQHRFNVCRLLKKNIYYVIRERLALPEIAKANSNQEKWNKGDFIQCFCENGNENYAIIRNFIEKHKVPYTTALILLSYGYNFNEGGDSRAKIENEFENGMFLVKKELEANALAEIINKFSFFKYNKQRSFITAIAKIIKNEKVQLKDLIESCSKNKLKLEKQLGWKQYINNLELIYNIGKHSRVIIY